MGKVDIKNLAKIINDLPGKDEQDKIRCLSIILLYIDYKCAGRIFVHKTLGYTERKTRSNIEKLVEKGFLQKTNYSICISEHASKLLGNLSINRKQIGKQILVSINGISHRLIHIVKYKLLRFRDYIVIYTMDPSSLEIIGYTINDTIYIPGLPDDLLIYYRKIIEGSVHGDALFILWNRYRKYIYDSVALFSIYKISKNLLI